MSPVTIGLLGIALMVILLFSGMPIAFVMAIIGVVGMALLTSIEAAFKLVALDFWEQFSTYSLTVIPVFLFMGQILFKARVSERIYSTAYTWLGQLPGGLAITTIMAAAGFSAVCGSGSATVATIGTVAMPEMRKYNYDWGLAAGVCITGGILGPLIPPSTVLIIYGILTEQSIGKLFIAGIIPGILLTVLYIGTIFYMCWKDPAIGPPGPRTSYKQKVASLSGTIDTILLFGLVIGGLYSGIFAPTEAGAVGAAGAVVMALVRRQLTWERLVISVMETIKSSCMILTLVAGAVIFGHFLTLSRIPTELASWVGGLEVPPAFILGMILFVYFIGGCVTDALALLIVTIPIFFPLSKALGIDPILFGILVAIITNLGGVTPPVGIFAYVMKGLFPEIPLSVIFKGGFYFLMALFLGVVIMIVFPQLVLYLPNLMY